MYSESEPTTPSPGQSRRGKVALAIFLLPLALGIVAPGILMLWEAASTTATVRRGDAGVFVSSTSSPGGFTAPSLTSVQTSEGSITVVGIFSAPRGRELHVERTNKGSAQLCVTGAGLCAPLAGDWPGSVVATPEAGRVFDFQANGLGYSNLGGWLVGGMLVSFFAMVTALIIASPDTPYCENDKSHDCADTGG